MIFLAGRFSPLGGLAFRQYAPCIASLFQQSLQPYFGQLMPEVMRVVRSYPFGITETTQPYNAIVVTLRAPAGMKLIALPTKMKLPTGQLDHRSWHDAPGAVPQLGTTNVVWFLKGTHEKGRFVPYSNAAKSTDPVVLRQAGLIQGLQPLTMSRLKRAQEIYDLQVRRLPKGADVSHLRNPAGSRREQKRVERRDARSSRSRSRSRSPGGRSARARTAAAADASQAGNRFSALGAVHEQQVLEEGEIAAAEAAAAETLRAAAAEPLPEVPEDDDELMPPAEFVHPHNNLIAGPD